MVTRVVLTNKEGTRYLDHFILSLSSLRRSAGFVKEAIVEAAHALKTPAFATAAMQALQEKAGAEAWSSEKKGLGGVRTYVGEFVGDLLSVIADEEYVAVFDEADPLAAGARKKEVPKGNAPAEKGKSKKMGKKKGKKKEDDSVMDGGDKAAGDTDVDADAIRIAAEARLKERLKKVVLLSDEYHVGATVSFGHEGFAWLLLLASLLLMDHDHVERAEQGLVAALQVARGTKRRIVTSVLEAKIWFYRFLVAKRLGHAGDLEEYVTCYEARCEEPLWDVCTVLMPRIGVTCHACGGGSAETGIELRACLFYSVPSFL